MEQPSLAGEAELKRSVDQVREEGNRLAGERSLYLRQHAHNPVDWYPWGPEALERAARLDRPIFLSIGYSSCHWCHVMEREVFEHDDVAELLNANFVAIKVDREERPDIDAVYMQAVMAMTGGGGWPLSVFLTPDLKPFFGGTFFPKVQFKQLLLRILETYRESREQVDALGQRLHDHLSAGLAPQAGGELNPEVFEQQAALARKLADREWGGFSAQMKFPMPVRWIFLTHLVRKTGDEGLAEVVTRALDAMARGGIRDHLAGGFHRYTVDASWTVPHFEKMLYDNALLALLYLEAGAALDRKDYLAVAADTLDYLIADLQQPGGGLAASQDADSDGQEGLTYVWTPRELAAVAGPEDGPALAALLGVTPEGNFEGRSVLTRRADPVEVASRFERDPVEVAELFDRHRAGLMTARAERPQPGLDRKVITSWNGLAVTALARGARVLDEPRFLQAAQRAAAFLLEVHRRPDGGLFRVSNDGHAEHPGVLDDYAFFAQGLLELYQAGGDRDHLAAASELLSHARARFRHPKAGYYLTEEDQPAPMGRQVELSDGVRPSGNAVMQAALWSLAALSGRTELAAQVEADLAAYAGLLEKAGLEMAGWLDVALMTRGPFYDVVVAGRSGDRGTRALVEAFRDLHPAHAVLVRLPAGGPTPEELELMPGLLGKRALDGKATAYVCKQSACKLPTSDPGVMRAQILEGWDR